MNRTIITAKAPNRSSLGTITRQTAPAVTKVRSFGALAVILLLPSCALFEGRRQAADCVTRHTAQARTGLAGIPAQVPEASRAPVTALVRKLDREMVDIGKWGTALADDFGPPNARVPLGGDAEDLARTRYIVSARLKNAIKETIPFPDFGGAGAGGAGGLLGLLAGGGGLSLAGIATIAGRIVKKKLNALAAERDRHRDTADDLHNAVEDLKGAAKNGGLKAKGFGEIMAGHAPAVRKHAECKLAAVT